MPEPLTPDTDEESTTLKETLVQLAVVIVIVLVVSWVAC
jgi:hypothetical protein